MVMSAMRRAMKWLATAREPGDPADAVGSVRATPAMADPTRERAL
jgi:hypothetical protein